MKKMGIPVELVGCPSVRWGSCWTCPQGTGCPVKEMGNPIGLVHKELGVP